MEILNQKLNQRFLERNNYLDLIVTNPIAIANELGYAEPFTEIHNEWIKLMLSDKDDTTLQAHRGSYKTTILAFTISLLMILRPNKAILFFRKTDGDAKLVINMVAKFLQSNIFLLLTSKIWGVELKLTEQSANNLTTNLFTALTGGSQLSGLGTQSSLTGQHADYIFTDDIVTLTDRTSRAERERIKVFYQELQNIKNRGGYIRNTGTPWHKDDAFQLMPEAKKYDCYTTALISEQELRKIKSKMTPALFAANYELRHIASEDVIFSNPNITGKLENIYNGKCHVDARYSGKDKTAFTVIGPDKRTVFIRIWDKHVDDCIKEIVELWTKYRAGTMFLETNADKGYLAKEFRKYNIPTQSYHESMNKHVKIITYLKPKWDELEFLAESDKDALDMICDYNEQVDHDDAPDSLASLLREMTKTVKWGW